MKVLIAGCGYLGKALGRNLVESGVMVWGLRRDRLALKSLEMVGIKPVQADLTKPESLVHLPNVDTVVLSQAPSKNSDTYHAVYYEAVENLVEALHLKKPKRILMISSTSVYGQRNGSWVNEGTSPDDAGYPSKEATARAKTLIETEELVLSGIVPAIVLRLGGIYGPRRNRLKALADVGAGLPAKGKSASGGKPAPTGQAFVNRIHVYDAVTAIRLLLEKGVPGEIYIGVDNEPCTDNEFYSWAMENLPLKKCSGARAAHEIHEGSNKRCTNQKLKQLGWDLKYPTFREGYQSLIGEIAKIGKQNS
ncbi:MAG: hypothetical protein COT00_04355 [Candidatus Omnitrophica bacterium CG07_land_8_20_14_0_80_50_8]|nr:MAG: hypothetical protein COT00_04355 [Candidatus Omnitrophica bacterium CG07_land_8_20_14_0_80_50_8]